MREGDPAFWEEVEAVFAEAIDCQGPNRSALLDARCADRPQLRGEVESLLAAHDSSERFLAVAESAAHPDEGLAEDWSGRTIGAFRLVRRVGEGGMGTVYLAERLGGEYTQRVAIKLLDASVRPDALRRFRAERQILATLHHPHVVTMLEGGLTPEGRAYLVMEYVEGQPISAYCADETLSLEGRLALFRDVCAAVQHAHQHGVVHRDLKPANILVAEGTVKVLDFGIAKLLDPDNQEADATVEPARALTPNYASPEQLRGLAVTTASDIYALGVLLYELVAGVRPYETSCLSLDRVMATVLDQEVRHPSAAADASRLPYSPRRLRGDIDTIVLKAMSKEPAQRYASAHELSEDVLRWLSGRPIVAVEPSLRQLAGRFVRRHRAAATVALASFGLVLGALGVSLYQTRVALRERDRAAARFDDVRQLAHALIFTIHDQVQPLPGSTPVRQAIVAEALKYLERLSRDPAGDDGLRLELARAYHRIGNVQGKPSEPNLGDPKGALGNLERGAELLRPMASGEAASPDARSELVRIDLSLATVASSLGERETATRASAEAALLAQALVERSSGSADARRLLGSALFQSAMLTKEPDSLDVWVRAGVVFDALLAERPDDPDRQRNVALVEKYLGGVLERHGRRAEAISHYQRALELDEARLERQPSGRTAQLDVAIDLGNLAYSQWKDGQPLEAAAGYERALGIRTRLAMSDPGDVRARRFEGYAHTRLASVYNELKRHDESLSHARLAVGIAEGLGGDALYRLDVIEALGELGQAHVGQGRAAEGCRVFARAMAAAATIEAEVGRLPDDARGRYQRLASLIRDRRATCDKGDGWTPSR